MKSRNRHRLASLMVCTSGMMVLGASVRLDAADWHWNPGGTGGDGIWGTGPGEKNWNAVPGAPAGNIAWPDTVDDVAVFQDAIGGVVTLSDFLQTSGIIQNGANYTLNAGVITLAPRSAAASPFIDVRSGSLTIDSVLDGGDGMDKGGAGTLVLANSNTYGGTTRILVGNLDLSGSLASTSLGISSGAALMNRNGGLFAGATVTNAGALTLDSDDFITGYVSNGGTLTGGAGTLFSTSASLNGGSIVSGRLHTGTLATDGIVSVNGTIVADSIRINSGTLANTGTLGRPTTLLNLMEGTTLEARGVERYSVLTTTGQGAATWRGNLANTSIIAPGGTGATGVLAVDGDFSQSPTGTMKIDFSGSKHDRIEVSGRALFGGTLELNQAGPAIAPFVPVTVVSASRHAGNITSIAENLDGAVWFNPGNGTVTRIEAPTGRGGSFFGATRNQTSTWSSLYDDVIDPGTVNITKGPGGPVISNGIADTGNPDLLWALGSSFAPGGLNAAVLNRLSPEVYGGFQDYAMQSTRAHQRSAMSAPPLDPLEKSAHVAAAGAKDGAKGGIAATAVPLDWEFFAAVDFFSAGTDNSRNQADYGFDGSGVLTGARARIDGRTTLAAYVGADTGTIDGALIDAEAFGWTFGALGEHLLHGKTRTRLIAGVSYGSYRFDGSRGGIAATSAGWAPGDADFSDVDTDAFELFVGVDGVAWRKDALTLIPSAGLRYATTTMDSFNESTGGVGSPIALDVDSDRDDSLIWELGLMAWVDVNDKIALWGEGGLNVGLIDDGRTLGARFAKGSRGMRTDADGLGDDAVYLGWGAVYRITGDIEATLGYRADFRSGSDAQQEIRLSSSWRF